MRLLQNQKGAILKNHSSENTPPSSEKNKQQLGG
jgi:hypothetical protein